MADEPAWQIASRIARCVRGCATDEQWQDLTDGIEAEITRLRSQGERAAVEGALRRALDIIETGFRTPFDHLEGCLYKADPRMPCQCDPRARIKNFRDEALTFLDEQRRALSPPSERGEGT